MNQKYVCLLWNINSLENKKKTVAIRRVVDAYYKYKICITTIIYTFEPKNESNGSRIVNNVWRDKH